MRWAVPVLCAVWLVAGPAMAPADAPRRVALIIANSDYAQKTRVDNAIRDASLIATRLKALGFEKDDIRIERNVDRGTLGHLIAEFAKTAENADSAVFYYAGHGKGDHRAQVWLLPVDIDPDVQDATLSIAAVSVGQVVAAMRPTGGTGMRIVLVDACRDKDITRGEEFRLVLDQDQEGVLVQISAADGEIADDGPPGGDSPYAIALDEALQSPSAGKADVRTILKDVRKRVIHSTGEKQHPVFASQIEFAGTVTFSGEIISPFPSADPKRPPPPDISGAQEAAVWSSMLTLNTVPGYDLYISRYPNGPHAGDAASNRKSLLLASLTPQPRQGAEPEAAVRLALATISTREWLTVSSQTIATRALGKTSVSDVLALAAHGDERAQFIAGVSLLNGLGGASQQEREGETWIAAAAAKGFAPAQRVYASFFSFGRGALKDDFQAAAWYRKAADQGDAIAQTTLGALYADGQGVPQDNVQSTSWYQKAAENNDPIAQANLGALYYRGQDATPDYSQAMDWLRKSAEQGFSGAQTLVGSLFEDGLGVQQDYSQAMTWYRKAADQGDVIAQLDVGELYANGHGVPQDYEIAMSFFRKAAGNDLVNPPKISKSHRINGADFLDDYGQAMASYDEASARGVAEAQNHIGVLYANGQGVPRDDKQAMTWYLLAAGHGNSDAQNNIGNLYNNGSGVQQDFIRAMEWYLKAANQDNAEAESNIGGLYANGLGVQKNYAQAMAWYRKAAIQGYADAEYEVGTFFFNGLGVPREPERARKWMWQAAAGGNSDAKKWLEIHPGRVDTDETGRLK